MIRGVRHVWRWKPPWRWPPSAWTAPRWLVWLLFAGLFLFLTGLAPAATNSTPAHPTNPIVLVSFEGQVEVARAGSTTWIKAATNMVLHGGDTVRTLERSRAVLRLSNLSLIRLDEFTPFTIPAPAAEKSGFNLLKGLHYFFDRDEPATFPIRTPTAYAIIIGTEFSIEVDEATDRTTVHLIDGRLQITNEFGRLDLSSGQSAVVEPGQRPARTPSIEAVNAIQWCLYYPGILDPDELELPAPATQDLLESLHAYRAGDLLSALARYPAGRQPASDPERVYLAAILLSVGRVRAAEEVLAPLPPNAAPRSGQLANALRRLMNAVKFLPASPITPPPLATSLLAESYVAQSQSRLGEALAHARAAADLAPHFGFAWARVAELEFGFGHRVAADRALAQALALSPRHAAAVALRGFVLASANRIPQALAEFNHAITLDSGLGNAWLGRGLCRIRQGEWEEGRNDLQTAVVVEPQRSALRSYLAKAFSHDRDEHHAREELRLARQLDPNDPTARLYAALLHLAANRINESIRDTLRASELAGNRSVYRGPVNLDQDRAVLGVNQARGLRDAGMADVAAREAGRALDADPANHAAHQFLGQSYQALRDLKGIDLRNETPAVSEFLQASLLAPVGAGTLAQSVSDQEYSKLFESDGFGVANETEYRSNGDWNQSTAQYGTFGHFGYALSAYYRSDNGMRPNNDLEQQEYSAQFQQELSPQDNLYLRAVYGRSEGGDLIPRYDPADANLGLRFREEQEPLLLAGYHRTWGPGSHSLLLGGWFRDDLRVENPAQGVLLLDHDNTGQVTGVAPIALQQQYRNEAEFFTTEAQQIWQNARTAFIAGGRYQAGWLDTRNQHTNASVLPFPFPAAAQHTDTEFQRWSAYAYAHWQIVEPLRLVAGLSYDAIRYPVNFRFAPLSNAEDSDEQWSPKGGLIWTPTHRTTVRLGYSQSLGGVGFEQSFRLEPTQVAGFNQAFRSLIPDSIAGANVAAPFESWSASFEQRIGSGTFLALSAERLESDVSRTVGVYDFNAFNVTPGSTAERLDFREDTLAVTLNQLAGEAWAFSAGYRVSRATLNASYPEIPAGTPALGGFRAHSDLKSVLHQVTLAANYNHPSGFFGRFESLWYAQSNQGYSPDQPGDDFWQFNAYAGWRFLQRRIEARVGVLNLSSRDYRLNPLNLAPELPRARTFMAGLRFNF